MPTGQRQHLLEEAYRLAESGLEPAAYFQALLPILLAGADARGAILWSSNGHNSQLEASAGAPAEIAPDAQQALLHFVAQQPKPLLLPPGGTVHSGTAINPTNDVLVIVPVLVEQRLVGFHQIHRDPAAPTPLGEVLPFLVAVAHQASVFDRNWRLRVLGKQQGLCLQLEEFARQLHQLDFERVAYVLANEGRRLIGGDRLSVLERRRGRGKITAVSGADVIAPRSRQMVQLAQLGQAVMHWRETLDFQGAPDEGLPQTVIDALDAYLEANACKRLMVLPLRDSEDETRPARFALVLELFESTPESDAVAERLRVVGRQAGLALANARMHRVVPLRRVWQKLAEWSDAPARAYVSAAVVAAAMIAFVLAATCLPYPLRLTAEGRLLPCQRRFVYSPVEAQVVRFEPGIAPGSRVAEGQPLALMYDVQLELKQIHLEQEIAGLQEESLLLAAQEAAARTEGERATYAAEKKQKELLRDHKRAELHALAGRARADEAHPGHFWLTAPVTGTVFSNDFREKFSGRSVRSSEALLRLGDPHGPWEVELRLPQQEVGPILQAFERGASELNVDLQLASSPTRVFRGKLVREKVGREALAEQPGEPSTVRALVRIDGPDILPSERVPVALLFAGAEVHARVCCGRRAIARALLHDVWNFLHEKVLLY